MSHKNLGGTCYHGAFATGKALHEETWADLGGGSLITSDARVLFSVSPGGSACAPVSDAKMGATHAYYTISGSATHATNGKYSRCGRFGGAPCFTNENDRLQEHNDNLVLLIEFLNETSLVKSFLGYLLGQHQASHRVARIP